MKPIKALGKLFVNLMFTFAIALAFTASVSLFTDVEAIPAAIVLTAVVAIGQTAALSFSGIANHSGMAFMAIQREIWQTDIVEALFKDNQFLNFAVNEDQYVLQGKVVHIPNAGSRPGVKVNRTVVPATVTQRTDIDVTYSLDELTTDPVHIPNADMAELSYDKRQSVMADILSTIREVGADIMVYKWAASAANGGTIIRTTGSSAAAHLPSATGNRKLFTIKDLIAADKAMNKQNTPKQGRYAMFSADMLSQLKEELTATQYRDFTAGQDIANGIVGKMYGFNILERATTATYTHGTPATLKAYGAAAATTDCDSVICWQVNSVARAMGDVKFFEDTDNPLFYGNIYSALLRLGGRVRRNDGYGVVSIVQDNA